MAMPKLPRDRISAHLERGRQQSAQTGLPFVRQTYRLHRPEAREKAQQWFRDFPKAAYWTQVESWRILDDDVVEFTMCRLPTAD